MMSRKICGYFLILLLVGLVWISAPVFDAGIWADNSEMSEDDEEEFSWDDFNKMMEWLVDQKRAIDVEKLIPPITVVIDQEANFDGSGYKMHAEATFVINKIWFQGTGIFSKENYLGLKFDPKDGFDGAELTDGLRTPAQYVQNRGGVLGFPIGGTLPFYMKSLKGHGTGWLGDERKTYSMNERFSGDVPSMLLQRTPGGVRILCENFGIDDNGEGLLNNFADLSCVVLQFDIKEGEMQSFSKTFSRQVSSKEYQASGKINASIRGSLEGVQADFTVSGSTRGAEIKLNASPSKGAITKYTWSFKALKPLPENVNFDSKAELTGEEVKVVLLEPVEVTLKVENGRVSHTKKKTVNIQKRKWQTPFKHEKEPLPLAGNGTSLICYGGEYPLHRQYGKNVCALSLERNVDGTVYYPDGQGSGFSKTWDTIGYQIEEVKKGPFKGTFYVSDYLLKIHRRSMINYNFFPGSPFYKINSGKYKSDLMRFYQARMDHERLHSDFLEQALQERDPARELERLFGTSRETLKEETDRLLMLIEDELYQKHADEDRVAAELKQKYGDETGIMNFYLTDDQDPGQITTFRFYIYNLGRAGY